MALPSVHRLWRSSPLILTALLRIASGFLGFSFLIFPFVILLRPRARDNAGDIALASKVSDKLTTSDLVDDFRTTPIVFSRRDSESARPFKQLMCNPRAINNRAKQ